MRTALDADPAKLDKHEQNFVAKIREHGWFQTAVFADQEGPGFAYTTGFWLNRNFPEIITFAMKDSLVHDVFWDLFRKLGSGEKLPVREPTGAVFRNLPAILLPVSPRQFKEYLGWSRWFYAGDNFQCLQLVWTDRSGRFPWDVDFSDEFMSLQPDLTDEHWAGLGMH